jgi:hypothetical protein
MRAWLPFIMTTGAAAGCLGTGGGGGGGGDADADADVDADSDADSDGDTDSDSGTGTGTGTETGTGTGTGTGTDTGTEEQICPDPRVDGVALAGTVPPDCLPVPEFEAFAHTGEARGPDDLVGAPTVMWFYPAAGTPG